MTTAIIIAAVVIIVGTIAAKLTVDPLGDHYADVRDALGEEVAR